MRVLHMIGLVLLAVLVISVSVATQVDMSLDALLGAIVWFAGCGVIVLLSRLWYGSRVKATQRLRSALESGSPEIKVVEVTRVLLQHVIPFGFEVDIELGDAEPLAFGFWTRETAERFQSLLGRAAP